MTKQEAASLAISLMKHHGIWEEGWGFAFSNTKRQLGDCNYRKQIIRVSVPFLNVNQDHVVLNTIKHEIAHALVGPGVGHGPAWKRMAVQVGAKPVRCNPSAGKVEPTLESVCPRCKRVAPAFRRTNSACRVCCVLFNHGKWHEDFKLIWRLRSVVEQGQ